MLSDLTLMASSNRVFITGDQDCASGPGSPYYHWKFGNFLQVAIIIFLRTSAVVEGMSTFLLSRQATAAMLSSFFLLGAPIQS